MIVLATTVSGRFVLCHAAKRRLSFAMRKLVERELDVVIGPPDTESIRIQRMLLDTAICQILEWSSQAEARDMLRRATRLRDDMKDSQQLSSIASTESLAR